MMIKTSTPRTRLAAAGLVAFIAFPTAAAAAPVAGFKVSTPVVEGLEVQIDLTAYVVASKTPSTIFAGKELDFTFGTTYITSADFGFGYAPTVYQVQRFFQEDWNTTGQPALDFGDFQNQQTVFLGLEPIVRSEDGSEPPGVSSGVTPPLNTYRGSFVHSYAAAGTYNIKAKLTPDGAMPTPGLGPSTSGNPYFPTPMTGSWVGFGSPLVVNRVYSLHIERTAAPTTAVQDLNTVTTPNYPSTLRYIENSVAGLTVDALPFLDVKTPNFDSNFGGNTTIQFTGDAMDPEDGDLTSTIHWSSDLDGTVGIGGDFLTTLSPGLHNFTVSVTDSFSNVTSENFMVNVSVGGPNLSVVTGLCPGLVTLEVGPVAPGDKVAFFTSEAAGVTTLGGACAGAIIDLDNAVLRSTRFGDGTGKVTVTRFFPLSQCGLMVQAINLGVAGSVCAVTNPLTPPIPPPPPMPPPISGSAPNSTRPKG